MIEPKSKQIEPPIDDYLTKKMERLLKRGKNGPYYRGFHVCKCGERSGNCDIYVGKYITNSLSVHYLRHHRSEVPTGEIEKLKNI